MSSTHRRYVLYALLGLLGIPCVFVLLVAGSIVYGLILHNTVRESVSFVVPGTEFEVEHSRLGIHPMMAEYERDLTFVVDGVRHKKLPLEIDTCGGYPINCYLIRTPESTFLRMDDATAEHVVDLENHIVFLVTYAQGDPYYGKLNAEGSSPGWSMMEGDPSTLVVTIGGQPAKPLSELIGDTDQVYVGKLDGPAGGLRFVPSSEAPEMPIRHLFPH